MASHVQSGPTGLDLRKGGQLHAQKGRLVTSGRQQEQDEPLETGQSLVHCPWRKTAVSSMGLKQAPALTGPSKQPDT